MTCSAVNFWRPITTLTSSGLVTPKRKIDGELDQVGVHISAHEIRIEDGLWKRFRDFADTEVVAHPFTDHRTRER